MKNHHQKNEMNGGGHHHYARFGLMMALSFAAMFALTYAMVDVWGNVYLNLNKAYMAALMTAPMAVIEIVLMGMMYPNKRLNAIIGLGGVLLGALCFLGIRRQASVGDRQFLRAMIPHHAAAVLMCAEAPIQDPEIKRLCEQISRSQQEEIDQMKAIMRRLESDQRVRSGRGD